MNNDALSDGVKGKKHTSPVGRRFGWKRDLPDFRDRLYHVAHPRLVEEPPKVDLIAKFPYVFDQMDSSSCTSNSSCYMYGALKGVTRIEDAFSRLFQYWNTRDYENDLNEDAGASIRDGIKLLSVKGVCLEKTWSFDLKTHLFTKPSDEAYKEALTYKIASYSRLLAPRDYRQCLAKGFAFTIGISCYDNLDGEQVARTGMLAMPGPSESITGGHCITVVGYDDNFHESEEFKKSGLTEEQYPYKEVFKILNSWGPNWGYEGCFFIPKAYIDRDDLSSDAWTIRV